MCQCPLAAFQLQAQILEARSRTAFLEAKSTTQKHRNEESQLLLDRYKDSIFTDEIELLLDQMPPRMLLAAQNLRRTVSMHYQLYESLAIEVL